LLQISQPPEQLGLVFADTNSMKAVFRADGSRGGFITATVVPSRKSQEPRFSLLDGVILIALVFGVAAMMRLVLAN